ncbi:MAG: ribonuclease Z [Candidatus Marinimicrobia bacterium]|jgi:ribonuclease Z|nr:ribonuclease Z [Candidatus Neomarinimicrobiota bacterium]
MLKSFQILGCSGGVPTQDRGVSSLIISTADFDIMIDCGEGTYLNWQRQGCKWKHLHYIFITHLHPDHCGGLIPLLFYRKLYGITKPLTLVGPPDLESFVLEGFQLFNTSIKQEFRWINIEETPRGNLKSGIAFQAEEMVHKIPCWGYRISDSEKNIVFVTDTLPNENAVKLAENADVLIHEATFTHDNRVKAREHYHSTQLQAMEIADKAKVQRLILTHFSQRIKDSELNEWQWNGQPCVVFNKRQIL